jgi:hypothetical protein
MRGIPPNAIEIPGYLVAPIELEVMVSNVITAYCAGNRRPAFISRIDPETHEAQLNNALTSIDIWQVQVAKIDVFSLNKRTEELMEKVRGIITGLTKVPLRVSDIGNHDADIVSQLNGWTSDMVITPSVGYPRKYVRLKADENRHELNGLNIPSPSNTWCQSIAMMLLSVDQGRFTTDLLPNTEAGVGTHSARERPIGAYLALTEQMNEIFRWYFLYSLQASLFVAHANRRYYTASYELAYSEDIRARQALEARQEAMEMLWALPLHPILGFIAKALQTGSINTYYGKFPALYRYGNGVGSTISTSEKENHSELRRKMVTSAISDYLTQKDVNWGDADADKPVMSIGDLAKRIRSTAHIWEKLSETATKLKWGSSGSGDIGEVNQFCADFTITDGTDYSSDPTAGLLGLKPVLSAANLKLMGFARRFKVDFNAADTRPQITYSVMVGRGYQSAFTKGDVLQRSYVLSGMHMGEDAFTVITAESAENDELVGELLKFYENPVSGWSEPYVRQLYSDGISGVDGFVQTDWDAFVFGSDVSKLRTPYLRGFDGQLEPVRAARFLKRELWFHRFIVAISRTRDYELYDELGGFQKTLNQDGNVVFDNAVAMSNTSAPIEAIVDILPQLPNIQHKLPAGIGGDQVPVVKESLGV